MLRPAAETVIAEAVARARMAPAATPAAAEAARALSPAARATALDPPDLTVDLPGPPAYLDD